MDSRDTRLIPTSSVVDTPLRESTYLNVYGEKERDVREYLSSLLKHKWLIISIVVVVTAAASVYSLNLPPIYESSAVLQLDAREYMYLEDGRGGVLRSYNNYDYQNTQVHLLSNPHLIRQVVLALDLESKPGFLNHAEETSIFTSIRRIFSRQKTASTVDQTSARGAKLETNVNELSQARIRQLEPYVAVIAGSLKIQPVESTNLVRVSMMHTDAQVAMAVVDALTKIFVTNSANYETKGSQQAAETLGRQISEIQTKIKEAEEARLNYLKSHDLPLAKGDGQNLTADRLGKLSSQLLDAENERKQIEATYEAAKKAKDPSTVPSAKDSDEIRELRKAINQLEQKRASLLEMYTAEWPEVKRVESEIRQLRDAIGNTSRETVLTLKAQLDAAAAREAKLREAYYQERGAANNQTQDEIALGSLNQQIDINRQVYNMLFQRQTELQVNSLDKSGRVAIVTPPVVPSAPIGPERARKIILAFLVSFVGAIGFAILLNQFDNTLKSAEEVARHLSLPTLALIPSVAVNGNGNGGLKSRILRRVRPGHHPEVTALALSSDVRSPTAEAYRHLRASLLFTAGGRAPRTILVTSGSPLEGKTTTAINTAITFAQSGVDVLLIDCDLRRPRVHRHFGLENRTGLTTYLSGAKDIDSLILTHDPYPNLKIITAGPMPANPADFLDSTEMRVLLKVVAERFAHVVIDSPPASSFADASILATQVDGVVIVAQSSNTSRGVVKRVKQRLEAVGAHVFGVVLNQVDLSTDDYYGGYYNSYTED